MKQFEKKTKKTKLIFEKYKYTWDQIAAYHKNGDTPQSLGTAFSRNCRVTEQNITNTKTLILGWSIRMNYELKVTSGSMIALLFLEHGERTVNLEVYVYLC